MSFPTSYAYCAGGTGLIWDDQQKALTKPTPYEQERAMEFVIGTTAVFDMFEVAQRHVLGQAMDLNCLTWIVSLALAEQQRLHVIFLSISTSMCSLPIGADEARAGGDRVRVVDQHPWKLWDVMREVVVGVARSVISGSISYEQSRVAREVGVEQP